jgi:hypothetical protein
MLDPGQRPTLAHGDLAAVAVGARIYRVRPGVVDGSLEVEAVEGTTKVASGTVHLPPYFQPATASIDLSGNDLVVSVTAFHCKDDRELEGSWVIAADCATRSTSW